MTPDQILVASAPEHPAWEGHTLAALAGQWGVTPDAAGDRILAGTGDACFVVIFTMDEADVRTVLAHPSTMIGSDGVHPTNAVRDISRSLPDNLSLLLRCCVDLDRSAVNTRSNAAETRRWVSERGFKSLIVVTSNYHMPRAIVELSHAVPNVTLIPFAVVGDRWRDEPWWTSGATLRLLLSEYAKYVAAEVRVRLADAGIDLAPELSDQPAPAPRRPATAQAN